MFPSMPFFASVSLQLSLSDVQSFSYLYCFRLPFCSFQPHNPLQEVQRSLEENEKKNKKSMIDSKSEKSQCVKYKLVKYLLKVRTYYCGDELQVSSSNMGTFKQRFYQRVGIVPSFSSLRNLL